MSVARQHVAFPKVKGCKDARGMLALAISRPLAKGSETRQLLHKLASVLAVILAVNKLPAPKTPGFDSPSCG